MRTERTKFFVAHALHGDVVGVIFDVDAMTSGDFVLDELGFGGFSDDENHRLGHKFRHGWPTHEFTAHAQWKDNTHPSSRPVRTELYASFIPAAAPTRAAGASLMAARV